MMKTFTALILILSCLGLNACTSSKNKSATDPLEVGIIVPIEHPAMDEIVQGFESSLSASSKKPIHYRVLRAQGDTNLQRSMILSLQNQNVALLVPISTGTTEMTAAMVKDIPIVGLAALLPEETRQKSQLALVDDEITPTQIVDFIHAIYPQKTQFTLIYSNNDKMLPQVQEAQQAGKTLGVQIDTRMISTLPDLYSISQSLSTDTQGIIVLKDLLVASGISTLVQVADAKNIPLITADDGTVENGAGFALGVKENQIGVEGAKVAEKILTGTPAQSIPLVTMKQLSVFINPKALKAQGQDENLIRAQTEKQGYTLVDMTAQQP